MLKREERAAIEGELAKLRDVRARLLQPWGCGTRWYRAAEHVESAIANIALALEADDELKAG